MGPTDYVFAAALIGDLPIDASLRHAHAMQRIDLSTFAGHLNRYHRLDCYCPGCKRLASCNLAELVRNGLGDRKICECRPGCRICGERGQWQVWPTMPTIN